MDLSLFHHRKRIFEREFDAQEMAQFARPYCEEAAEPTSYEFLFANYPHFARLFQDSPEIRDFVNHYLPLLGPFCQSPFPLPEGRVIQGPWVALWKTMTFPACEVTAESVANKRVLDIGCNAGWDTFYLAALDPVEIIAIEPSPFYYQALFLWTLYNCHNTRFIRCGWESLTPELVGTFDLINCQGILYHEYHPLALLQGLHRLIKPGGKLILETHVLMDEGPYALFVEGTFWGDDNWWWIPTIDTVSAMLRVCGFSEVQFRFKAAVPSKNPADSLRTIEGLPAGGRAYFTALRPA